MITSLSFDILIITYYAMFVNIFFTSFLFLLLASRFVKRKSPCLLNVRYFLLLVFISITTFLLSCIYYIILFDSCQGVFLFFLNFLYYSNLCSFLNFYNHYTTLAEKYNRQNAQILGYYKLKNLCNLPIDKCGEICYNGISGRYEPSRPAILPYFYSFVNKKIAQNSILIFVQFAY